VAKINFNYHENFRIPGAINLKRFLEEVVSDEKKELHQLNYIFCSDEYLLKINQDFLKHDDYTDIITFDLGDGSQIKGEIYISVERVKENAILYKSPSFMKELFRVIIHGLLHLVGYGDKKKSESKVMRAKEDYYLLSFEEKFNVSL
jgi:rRNA maturation RNase YbeY